MLPGKLATLIVSVRLWILFVSFCLAFDIHHWRFGIVMHQSPFLILSLYTLRDENRRDLMDMDISNVHEYIYYRVTMRSFKFKDEV